ncbi:uncharacterized protein LOC116017897 [Ipomoea triloba]|uniref:uncharacterized protein LOC116017897 n=1 Tax=Ipomoea triloba TaxID=35885 RepID=UPI00125E0D02|nr:uncharacterized protein LOC116017897 [Ipomoea triloba]
MASLTPGVLLKLLQNVDDKDAKVVGEHRSALLQVISIVPSLDDDPWKSRGFYLRVSDSEHSAYVSVSDEDAELILSDSVQLGQFIHVTRLDSGSPVPVLRGLKPVAKRRPCVGEPKDLISSDFLTAKSRSEPKKVKKKNGEVRKMEGKAKESVKSEDLKGRRRHSIDAGKVEGMEMKRVSLDSMRRGWDPSPSGKNGSNSISKNNPLKSFSPDSVCSQKKVSLEKDLTPRRISMGASPLQNKNIIVSPKLVSKPSKKDVQTSQDDALPGHLMKVDVSLKNLSDSRVFWSSLPSPIHCLGKDVMAHRNAAFCSAMQALEEASAAEGVIHCMSMFAELCELSDRSSAGQVVERFLHLQERMQSAVAVIYALMNRRALETKSKDGFSLQYSLPEMCKNGVNKNAALWVQAAVDTNLSRFCLFSNQQKGGISYGEKHYCAIIENSPKKTESENLSPKDRKSPRNHGADVPNCNTKGQPSRPRRSISAAQNTDVGTQVWSKGDGLKDAATLAEKLLSHSRTWFLNYLETNLDVAFRMQKGEGNPEIARLLGQLKRVNQWLDNSRPKGDKPDESIEGLRKKLYGFLLDHVVV